MAHDPVHLVQKRSEILSPSRNFNPLNLLNGSHPSMIEVRSIDDRRPLDHGYALDYVSKLNDLLDPSVNIAWVGRDINDDITVQLRDQSHMSRARMLWTNAQRERLCARVTSHSWFHRS